MRRRYYFSLEEANALIPTLEQYCPQMIVLLRDLHAMRQMLQGAGVQRTAEGMLLPLIRETELLPLQQQYESACERYDHILQELADLGVEVVDAESGVMNLYSWWEGEEVVLSWQYGEPTVQFWCDPGDRFADRRSIRQLYYDVPAGRAVRH